MQNFRPTFGEHIKFCERFQNALQEDRERFIEKIIEEAKQSGFDVHNEIDQKCMLKFSQITLEELEASVINGQPVVTGWNQIVTYNRSNI